MRSMSLSRLPYADPHGTYRAGCVRDGPPNPIRCRTTGSLKFPAIRFPAISLSRLTNGIIPESDSLTFALGVACWAAEAMITMTLTAPTNDPTLQSWVFAYSYRYGFLTYYSVVNIRVVLDLRVCIRELGAP